MVDLVRNTLAKAPAWFAVESDQACVPSSNSGTRIRLTSALDDVAGAGRVLAEGRDRDHD